MDRKSIQQTNHFFRYMGRTPAICLILIIALTSLCQANPPSAKGLQRDSTYSIAVKRWPEAEQIFHSDPRWLGGDGATSVDLGNSRVLWLFGDSFIDISTNPSRRTAALVRNSLAIQNGYNPAAASMRFHWKQKDGKPAAFFFQSGEIWYWPASGIMVGRHLLIFLMEIITAPNKLGFDVQGWKAVLIKNPHEQPQNWRLTYLKSPQLFNLIAGSACPWIEKNFLITCATNKKNHSVSLLRWHLPDVHAGTLTRPQWWAGKQIGWSSNIRQSPKPILCKGQMEFSLAYRPEYKCFFLVQTLNQQNPCLSMAYATQLTGSWTEKTCFFTPPEYFLAGNLIYAGKSHPALKGADLICTYVVNTLDKERLLDDISLYYPILLQGRIIPGQ